MKFTLKITIWSRVILFSGEVPIEECIIKVPLLICVTRSYGETVFGKSSGVSTFLTATSVSAREWHFLYFGYWYLAPKFLFLLRKDSVLVSAFFFNVFFGHQFFHDLFLLHCNPCGLCGPHSPNSLSLQDENYQILVCHENWFCPNLL